MALISTVCIPLKCQDPAVAVLLMGLGETERDRWLALINAGLNRSFLRSTNLFHIRYDIGVGRELIHGFAAAAAVHQHHRTAIGDHPGRSGSRAAHR